MGIIRKIFGPSREEIWTALAAEFNGRFVDGKWNSPDRVYVTVGEWEILLDHFSRQTGKTTIPYTRIRSPFTNQDNLYFKIYRQGFFSGVAKYFGMQDIQLNDEEFDKDFVLKGNDVFKINWIFESTEVRKYLYELDKIHLEIKNDDGFFKKSHYNEGIDELYFEQSVKDFI